VIYTFLKSSGGVASRSYDMSHAEASF